MTAEEAKAYGIVDDVVTKNKMKKARGYVNSLAFLLILTHSSTNA